MAVDQAEPEAALARREPEAAVVPAIEIIIEDTVSDLTPLADPELPEAGHFDFPDKQNKAKSTKSVLKAPVTSPAEESTESTEATIRGESQAGELLDSIYNACFMGMTTVDYDYYWTLAVDLIASQLLLSSVYADALKEAPKDAADIAETASLAGPADEEAAVPVATVAGSSQSGELRHT